MGVLGSGIAAQTISARLAVIEPKGEDWLLCRDCRARRNGLQRHQRSGFAECIEDGRRGESEWQDPGGCFQPVGFFEWVSPSLTVFGTDSLAEQIQRAFPFTKVVKTLNTVNARVMVYPQEVAGGDHHVFISADDPDAKAQVTELLRSFGWINIFDLGDLSTARGTEAYLLLWVRLYGSMNTSMINVKIMK